MCAFSAGEVAPVGATEFAGSARLFAWYGEGRQPKPRALERGRRGLALVGQLLV